MECSRCDFHKSKNCNRQCMDIPNRKTCADCVHTERCITIFGAKPENRSCNFEPIRYRERQVEE